MAKQSKNKCLFDVGQLIHHKRYGYRGVIFDHDLTCKADEQWYQKNKTQPPRDQPWYHVLVHGRMHTTYVAQSSLEPDPSGVEVIHPWIEKFFASFLNGRYWRQNLN